MKRKMKLLIWFTTLCMVLIGVIAVPKSAQAADSDSGIDGEIQWEITGDTLTFSAVEGTQGRMDVYDFDGSFSTFPWRESNLIKDVKNVIVKDGITQLSGNAFWKEDIFYRGLELDSMIISGTVDTIPFGFCFDIYSIDRLVVNEGVKNIELEAFPTKVHNFICAKSVQTINVAAFCIEADVSIVTSENVYGYSGSAAEKYVSYLKEDASNNKIHYLDGGIRNADSWKFISIDSYKGDLEDFDPSKYNISDTIPKPTKPKTPNRGTILKSKNITYKVTKKGSEVAYTKISSTSTSVNIPNTVKIGGITYKVTSVSANAFKGNKKLSKVTIGANITSIGKNVFSGCKNLKTITIKSTKLKSVGQNAFKGIKSTARIKVPSKQLKAYKRLLKGKGQGKKVKITK